MSIRTTLLLGAAAFAVSTGAFAQRGSAAFTATSTRCEDVRWSAESLERYPRIASACREVVQRDGTYFVRFEGEVQRVADRGRQVTIDFRGGDTLTLEPPENLSLTINGRTRQVRDLRPGDQLTFFVPENQLAATFFAGQPDTSEPQTVPIAPSEPRLAQAEPDRELPRTASALPAIGAFGWLLVALGAALTLVRRLRS